MGITKYDMAGSILLVITFAFVSGHGSCSTSAQPFHKEENKSMCVAKSCSSTRKRSRRRFLCCANTRVWRKEEGKSLRRCHRLASIANLESLRS